MFNYSSRLNHPLNWRRRRRSEQCDETSVERRPRIRDKLGSKSTLTSSVFGTRPAGGHHVTNVAMTGVVRGRSRAQATLTGLFVIAIERMRSSKAFAIGIEKRSAGQTSTILATYRFCLTH